MLSSSCPTRREIHPQEMPYNIAIVGAGPAGSVLARLLLNSDKQIKVTIFEAEAGIDFRSQGGSLDLHEKTGQAALKAAGLFDEFLKWARYDGEAMKIADKKLLCYIKQGAAKKGSVSSTGRPEIDRPKLRELLFNSLPAGTVQWNKKLRKVDDSLTLHFADGSTQSGFDLIVGADGAWSKVRPLLSNVQPYYSGIAGHQMIISDAEKNAPDLYEMVNRGSLFSFSDSKSIMSQQMGDGCINVSTWSTPFAGEGVNLAFADAMKLAELIISAASTTEQSSDQKDTLDKNVKTFEQDMFKRATETQQLTVGAPRKGIEKYILRAVSGELGTLVTNIVLAPIVYTWFFFFKLIY
ncbi:Monooxygenase asqM [Pseudocercospora fuligena]|uniref:Monooxygenase asqM n=1 Tax=Pseudocercospora fuligena TaxID=685502 RepID=A0A8H6VDR8_9PEZI|nr:Monooxygenase asqM [Pseudocercospora fuligena]